MENPQILNNDLLATDVKNDIVLKNFDRLMFGEHITMLYDKDPINLYYDFLTYRDGLFEWQYLEAGPDVWMIKIKNIGQDFRTVADVLLEYPKASKVFSKHKIDYCCQGNRLFIEVCKEAGVEAAKILKKIEDADAYPEANEKAVTWPLDFLIDYIQVVHHQYVKENKPAIINLLLKVQDLHGELHPVLYNINLIFNKLAETLKLHMQKEEVLVFPAIKSMVNCEEEPFHYTIRTLEDLVRAMKIDHDEAGEGMASIRNLTENYHLPEDACDSFKLLYDMLQEFENDLHVHVHLENNVLFPKALALRKEIS